MTEWYKRGDKDRPNGRNGDKSEGSSKLKLDTHVIKAYFGELSSTPAKKNPRLSKEDCLLAHDNYVAKTQPLRMLIESEILIRELQDISKVHLHQKPLALIPPYKLLIHHWQGIEETLQILKSLGGSSAGADSSTNPEEADIHTRIEHLQCLYDFMQTDLAHLHGLRLKVREAKLQTISFEELYYLFSPGDLVVSSETKSDQLYQVYAVTGGRMRLKKPDTLYLSGRRRDEKLTAGVGTWTSVRLECYILAWDGKQIGPFQFTHEIHHFAGKRAVRELEAYPVGFEHDTANIQRNLRHRGRDVITHKGHKRYAASSLQPLWPLEVFVHGTQNQYIDTMFMQWDEVSKRKASEEIIQDIDSDVYLDYSPRYRCSYPFSFPTEHMFR